ncbi:MAG TPA: peptidase M2 family protein, partial [Lysobacter sp.]
MKQRHALLALAVAASLLSLSACKKEPTPAPDAVVVPEGETADEFVARVNQEYKKLLPELSAAQWLSST